MKSAREKTSYFPGRKAGAALLVLILGLAGCGRSGREPGEVARLIDRITEKEIVASPMRGLLQHFHLVRETVTDDWIPLPALASPEQEVWAVSTGFPVLADPRSDFPEGVRLTVEDREVPHLAASGGQGQGWRWLPTTESLDLRNFEGYDADRRGIRLDGEHAFTFPKLLPWGEVVIDLYLANPDLESPEKRVLVTFNDEAPEEIVVSRNKWYRIRRKTRLGHYTISVRFPGGAGAAAGSVTLGNLKISAPSDIILFSRPRSQGAAFPGGTSFLEYYTHTAVPGKYEAPVPPELHYYFHLRNRFRLRDAGCTPDPLGVKKKIVLGEYSLNALMAPPRSEYRMDVDIPPGTVLEFGYGIWNEFRMRKAPRVFRFQVLLETSSGEQTLLDEAISWDRQKNILRRRIPLEPGPEGRGVLSFITTKAGGGEAGEKGPTVVPLWVNPVLCRAPETPPQNVILISLDTLRPDHLGCYGYGRETSPAMDSLASDGALFQNVFSTTSWTLPGHVSMLTSLEGRNHQVYYPLQKMDETVPTLADFLRRRGFYCAAFTGGGYLSQTYGFSKGFDAYQEIKLHGDRAIRLDEAERLASLALEWLEENQGKRFFLFLHTYQPHDPYANLSPLGKKFLREGAQWEQVRMETLLREKGRFHTSFTPEQRQNIVDLYDGEIKYTDAVFVHPILDKLKQLGLYENSLVILTSDHGEEFFEHDAWLHDHSIYNEGIKIPLIIKFPGFSFKGHRVEATARITDIVPTVLDLVGAEVPGGTLDGESLLRVLEGREKKTRSFTVDLALRGFDVAPSIVAVNQDHYKLIANRIIVSPYTKRIVHDLKGEKIELYDLEKDPGEKKNLAPNIAYRELCFQLLDTIKRRYEEAEQKKKAQDEVTLDDSLRERLKALGYIK